MRRLLRTLVVAMSAFALVAGAAAAGVPPRKLPPTNVALPTISGTAQTGSTLTATSGTWGGQVTAVAYQWLRCGAGGTACTPITGQTTTTHLISPTEAGVTLRVAATASNKNGATTANSAPTAVVATPAPSTPPPAPSAGQNGRFGFAAGGNIQNLGATDLTRYLDGAQAAHTGWIRVDLNWSVIQADGPTSYNWAPFDNVVRATTARGMKVLAGILYTPAWARSAGMGANTPPADLTAFATFARTAVARYAPMGVHAYEVWNEPNIVNFWAPGPDPARYTQLLKLAYPAIKGADPSASVISAGLSPYGAYGETDAQHMNPLTFLERMYASGAAGSFDAVGWHPYNYPWGLGYATWSAWSQMSQTSPSARSIMTAHGDAAKQIWATEFGAPTGSTTRDITEAAQAKLVTDSYTQLKSWSWAGPAFFYSYHDNGTNKSDVEQNFGVMHFDWTPKLSYAAYQSAAAAG